MSNPTLVHQLERPESAAADIARWPSANLFDLYPGVMAPVSEPDLHARLARGARELWAGLRSAILNRRYSSVRLRVPRRRRLRVGRTLGLRALARDWKAATVLGGVSVATMAALLPLHPSGQDEARQVVARGSVAAMHDPPALPNLDSRAAPRRPDGGPSERVQADRSREPASQRGDAGRSESARAEGRRRPAKARRPATPARTAKAQRREHRRPARPAALPAQPPASQALTPTATSAPSAPVAPRPVAKPRSAPPPPEFAFER